MAIQCIKLFMIKSFRHKGLEQFYVSGIKSGIQPHHAAKLSVQLTAMQAAETPDDSRMPTAWRLHQLSGDMKGFWSITVNGNWRVIFRFDKTDIELVDYLDYY